MSFERTQFGLDALHSPLTASASTSTSVRALYVQRAKDCPLVLPPFHPRAALTAPSGAGGVSFPRLNGLSLAVRPVVGLFRAHSASMKVASSEWGAARADLGEREPTW